MSGPLRADDVEDVPTAPVGDRDVEVTSSRESEVGGHRVRRALPQRVRRTVGAWCFADHMGPASVAEDRPFGVGPHPHTGLQTATWLLRGELLHLDSVGSEQPIRPGQLNLMTAGRGVAHAEEGTGGRELHGIQLWIAQPDRTRHGAPAFEHHAVLPQVEIDRAEATVLVGAFGDVTSPARRDTDHVGVDLHLRAGRSVVPLAAGHEHALVVLEGAVRVAGRALSPGHLAYLGSGRIEVVLDALDTCRAILLGGEPFEARPLMWWNFVARSTEEIDAAVESWNASDGRFGATGSSWPTIPAPRPPWAPTPGS